jgi:hypothetical protein
MRKLVDRLMEINETMKKEQEENAWRESSKYWEESSRVYMKNEMFYREQLEKIGKLLGPEVYIADDESKQQDVLILKIPEMIEKLKIDHDHYKREFYCYKDIVDKIGDVLGSVCSWTYVDIIKNMKSSINKLVEEIDQLKYKLSSEKLLSDVYKTTNDILIKQLKNDKQKEPEQKGQWTQHITILASEIDKDIVIRGVNEYGQHAIYRIIKEKK